jgi:hypothetical protein
VGNSRRSAPGAPGRAQSGRFRAKATCSLPHAVHFKSLPCRPYCIQITETVDRPRPASGPGASYVNENKRVAYFAQLIVHFAPKLIFAPRQRFFHNEFREVFHRFCAKKNSPCRTRRGSPDVKSTIVDGKPAIAPLVNTRSAASAMAESMSSGRCAGGRPLRLTLDDARGPVITRSFRSQSELGTRTAIVSISREAASRRRKGRIAVTGAGQIFDRTSRTSGMMRAPAPMA